MNRTYIVINTNEIVNDMINESVNTAMSFRKSLDGTKGILKFETAFPASMVGHLKRNHSQIVQYLIDNSTDWEGGE